MKRIIALCLLFTTFIFCIKPTSPAGHNDGGYKIVSRYATSGYALDVEIRDSLVFVAQGEGGLAIVNVSNRKNPKLVSEISDGIKGAAAKIAIKDTLIYMAMNIYGVTVINVSTPLQPQIEISGLNMKAAKNVFAKKDFLFASVGEKGVKTADITSVIPDVKSGFSTPGYAYAVTTSLDSKKLLVACGEIGFSMFDISTLVTGFEDCEKIGTLDLPGYSKGIDIIDETKCAVLASGREGIFIVDYSDSLNIRIKGSFKIAGNGYADEVFYQDEKVFIADDNKGLIIVSLADISKPKLIGVVDIDEVFGITADKNFIYLASKTEGLVIVSIPD